MPGGGDPDYDTLNDWEAASQGDYSGLGILILDCYDSQTHNDKCALSGGGGEDMEHHREIRSSPNCASPWIGERSGGAHIINTDIETNNYTIYMNEKYSRIVNLGISFQGEYNQTNVSSVYMGAEYTMVIGCFIYDCDNKRSGDYYGNGIYASGQDGTLIFATRVDNCENWGISFTTLVDDTGGVIACEVTNCINGIITTTTGTTIGWSNHSEGNLGDDYEETGWSSPSGWNSSGDETSDLGGAAGDNYKHGVNFAATEDRSWNGAAGDRAGRNPNDDMTSQWDADDFFPNDTAGEAVSKLDIKGNSRSPWKDARWGVGSERGPTEIPDTSDPLQSILYGPGRLRISLRDSIRRI